LCRGRSCKAAARKAIPPDPTDAQWSGRRRLDRVGLHDKGHIALQFGVGTVKFRKVEIKPL